MCSLAGMSRSVFLASAYIMTAAGLTAEESVRSVENSWFLHLLCCIYIDLCYLFIGLFAVAAR